MKTKTAMITIAGRPNVGKSTLANALVGEKIAIVSHKPQTTRNRICAIVDRGDTQLVFIDTPGFHRPRTKLGDYMVNVVKESVSDVDLILLLVDPIQAVIFGVLILVIQQVDGNFIGPKILGSSIGISALWILFSIVVGGDLFGLVGMVVGVPLFATFYGLAQEFVHYTLDKRGLDSEGNHVAEVVEDAENVFE